MWLKNYDFGSRKTHSNYKPKIWFGDARQPLHKCYHEVLKHRDGLIFLQPYTLKQLHYIFNLRQRKRILVAGLHIVQTHCLHYGDWASDTLQLENVSAWNLFAGL